MTTLHHSHRRPTALQDSDYDHEISLVDKSDLTSSNTRSRPQSLEASSNSLHSSERSGRQSGTPLRKETTLHKELVKRKYSKYQTGRAAGNTKAADDGLQTDERPDSPGGQAERGRTKSTTKPPGSKSVPKRATAIDILYENQRGGFLCGMPLFSSRALGNLDPSPWTNVALKTSATNTTNAQVPDPSWEWSWRSWVVNHDDDVDTDGWEYSFAFSRKFSWHGPTWWNSFVRRRAWIRQRVKKDSHKHVQEAHMLNEEYFTIHPAMMRSRSSSSSRAGSRRDSRYSIGALARRHIEAEAEVEDIVDAPHLMKAVKEARIDREKLEALTNFIANGGQEIYYLKDYMHEIMATFIFQASRRLLSSQLSRSLEEAVARKEKLAAEGEEETDEGFEDRRVNYLEAAVKAADEQVKKLEFWSDIKILAENGETLGAVDASRGWDNSWSSIDNSAPRNVISDRTIQEKRDKKIESNVVEISEVDKGKGKDM